MRTDATLRPTLYPPVTYGHGWTVLGLCLVAGVALVLVVVLLSTRPGGLPRLPGMRRSTRVRRQALARVDAVLVAYEAGRVDAPGAASELSQTVRGFAAAWTGVAYETMTPSQLATAGPVPLHDVVSALAVATFAPAPGTADVATLARDVREVVTRWSTS
ncbi:hypothetical protein Cch01nite_06110 [Cellulomonas chitinilytica]|uniref:Uncharacterized protein n=1 Tax=Cellulomonas chitinilytica TaxID=398759 RepID=A0A919NYJ2_9CELL|nr:hypothetical protein [Cellulomonas chitinilytica]GIG19887.1 hypothetical protein Cch01nite_06110 [Cellulomonas chitinilytica]